MQVVGGYVPYPAPVAQMGIKYASEGALSQEEDYEWHFRISVGFQLQDWSAYQQVVRRCGCYSLMEESATVNLSAGLERDQGHTNEVKPAAQHP